MVLGQGERVMCEPVMVERVMCERVVGSIAEAINLN